MLSLRLWTDFQPTQDPIIIANSNKAQTLRVCPPYLQQTSYTVHRRLASASDLRRQIKRFLSIVHVPQFLRASKQTQGRVTKIA